MEYIQSHRNPLFSPPTTSGDILLVISLLLLYGLLPMQRRRSKAAATLAWGFRTEKPKRQAQSHKSPGALEGTGLHPVPSVSLQLPRQLAVLYCHQSL
ncbi:hypothetical protein SODALDRAFT_354239 [Sodiomyces alkalinus F11]|uniref:Uncharacterized protein n=1 Tax=Sodiomyces alkalinus (strain CBS 110278 / VKM F-3762 / F11) TaxID=1314773 RepID=A0A3N2Q5Q7_SODAK|nr:hypothetical protein SODALDRAFT_354239 [Sodiomyces alkalinus F11]ROT42114.1 hypothetical protein SODALDRAFT_354239 [Sodiomyces alkalinus F11]